MVEAAGGWQELDRTLSLITLPTWERPSFTQTLLFCMFLDRQSIARSQQSLRPARIYVKMLHYYIAREADERVFWFSHFGNQLSVVCGVPCQRTGVPLSRPCWNWCLCSLRCSNQWGKLQYQPLSGYLVARCSLHVAHLMCRLQSVPHICERLARKYIVGHVDVARLAG